MVYLLSQLIDQSAESHPHREAFHYREESLTYAELSRRTHQLANVLKDQGIGRGDRVGIFMNKCIEMPMAVHGILKAGAAYVPIDPAAPALRLKFIIQDCDIRILITQNSKVNLIRDIVDQTNLKGLIGVNQTFIPALRSISWDEVFKAPGNQPYIGPSTEMDLAYIMYTSGSTGEPKGIMHTHHSGLSYANGSAKTYGLHENDILGNHSPLHFDMSTFEFFSGPLKGACSVLIPEEYTKLPASLSRLIADMHLTIWYSVPFALIQLLLRGEIKDRDFRALRWILFGGEPFPVKYLKELMEQLPHTRFSNVYGPAEVNQCTYYHVPLPPKESDAPIPIGRIWPNSEGLVVNENNSPVNIDEIGELLIRSPTMMQGYWNREDLNLRCFYHRSPFPGYTETFFRSGDLVRMTTDGIYEYIGRKDRQIKIRGYRVELGEIETALSAHNDVEEAAAYTFTDKEGNVQLFASITVKRQRESMIPELMKHLKNRLPWYAVPQHIEIVDTFIRTPTGKIDRNALIRSMQDTQHSEPTLAFGAKQP